MSNKTLSIVTALSLSSLTLAACAGSTAAGPRPVNVAQVRNEIADTIGRSHDSRSVVSMGKVTPERATVFTANGTGARHRQEGHRLSLTAREQHVELAPRRRRADRLGLLDQLVGGLAHRGHDDNDLLAGRLGARDALGDQPDLVDIRDGRAAVLLNNDACRSHVGDHT